MAEKSILFVEGDGDRKFFDCLLEHVAKYDIGTAIIGGGASALHKVQPQIIQRHDEGKRVVIVFDADADVEGRREEVRQVIIDLDLPVNEFFLLPNNNEPGCLENLLQAMAVDRHKAIYDCFELYEECLNATNPCYVFPPLKAKIYAYCEPLGIETQAPHRDFGIEDYWNLDTPALGPLKDFLNTL